MGLPEVSGPRLMGRVVGNVSRDVGNLGKAAESAAGGAVSVLWAEPGPELVVFGGAAEEKSRRIRLDSAGCSGSAGVCVPFLPAGMSYSSSLGGSWPLGGTEIIHAVAAEKHKQLFPGGVSDLRNSNRTFLIFTAAAKSLKEKGNEG